MTAAKKNDEAEATVDTASKEVQARFDREQEQGYVGIKVDPTPDEAYALTSGPDSPPHVPNNTTRAGQTVLIDEPGTKHEVKDA